MKYLLVSNKKWNYRNFKKLNARTIYRNNISQNLIKKLNPKIIFFIFWSKKIHKNIYTNNLCIQFHCSNLPNFRGGSPVQNQILHGLKKTKISAFRVDNKIDAGDICLKKNLSLRGSANIIYERIEKTAISMINKLVKKKNINFTKQKGKGKFYRRRKKEDSNLISSNYPKIESVYNFIRMLDAENYPKAFLNLQRYMIEFKNAKLKNNEIRGEFKIFKKQK